MCYIYVHYSFLLYCKVIEGHRQLQPYIRNVNNNGNIYDDDDHHHHNYKNLSRFSAVRPVLYNSFVFR